MAHEVKSVKEFVQKCFSGERKVVKLAKFVKQNQQQTASYKMRVRTCSGAYTFVVEDSEKTQRLIEKLKERCDVQLLPRVCKIKQKKSQAV